MCMLSAIFDYTTNIPQTTWTIPAIDSFKEIIDRVKDLDKKLNQPDCEDPAKAEIMKKLDMIAERLEKLEASKKKGGTKKKSAPASPAPAKKVKPKKIKRSK